MEGSTNSSIRGPRASRRTTSVTSRCNTLAEALRFAIAVAGQTSGGSRTRACIHTHNPRSHRWGLNQCACANTWVDIGGV